MERFKKVTIIVEDGETINTLEFFSTTEFEYELIDLNEDEVYSLLDRHKATRRPALNLLASISLRPHDDGRGSIGRLTTVPVDHE